MPAQRRLPKRGFKNPFRKEITIVNLETLESFDDGAVVEPQTLLERGIIKKVGDGVKILAKGELTKKLTVRAHAISRGALEKIQKAGGVFEELPGK